MHIHLVRERWQQQRRAVGSCSQGAVAAETAARLPDCQIEKKNLIDVPATDYILDEWTFRWCPRPKGVVWQLVAERIYNEVGIINRLAVRYGDHFALL